MTARGHHSRWPLGRLRLRAVLLLVLGLTSVASLVRAGNDGVEPAKYIPLFLKIVTYHQQFETEGITGLRIGILFDKSEPRSYQQFLTIESYLKSKPGLTAAGIPVSYKAVPFHSLNDYVARLSSQDYNVLIVTAVRPELVKQTIAKTQVAGIHSFALEPHDVELGIAVAVDPGRKDKSILVNLESSRREGAKFSAHLLRLCQIVGG